MDRLPDNSEVVEQVRVNLLRMLAKNKGMTYASVARAVHRKEETIGRFVRREYSSITLAALIAAAFPEIGDIPGRCPHCGRLPTVYE